MKNKPLFGIMGAFILFIGVFMPIVKLPIIGSINYFNNGTGDGVVILVFAVATLICVMLNKYKYLWFTGLGSMAMLLITVITFGIKMSQARADIKTQLAGNPFSGLAEMAVQSVQLQWGWALLVVGAGLVILSAAMKEKYGIDNDQAIFNENDSIKLVGNDQNKIESEPIIEIQPIDEDDSDYSSVADESVRPKGYKESQLEKRAKALFRKCDACGRMVSKKASVCHHCKAPIERNSLMWLKRR